MIRMEGKKTVQRFVLLLVCLVTACSFTIRPARAEATAFDAEKASEKLDMKLFSITDQLFKVTAHGLLDTLDSMQAALGDGEYCTYYYTITMHALNGLELHGSLRYAPEEPSPVTRISAFARYLRTEHNARATLTESDGISWIVEIPKRLMFNARDISGCTVQIHTTGKNALSLEKKFDAADVLTDDSAVTEINDMCTLRVTVPEQKKLVVSIQDPLLKTGYTNSPDGQGSHSPVWYIKAKISTSLWVEAKLDGRESPTLDDNMQFRAGEYHYLKDGSNKYHAKTFDLSTASYHIDGDTIVMELTVPDELKHDFRKLIWIEITMNNGTQKSHYRIR